jgi:hypothetical protein
MVRAWVCHKGLRRGLAIILSVGVWVANAAAQQPAKSHSSSAPRAIVMPLKALAGAQATLAVLDSQGRLLPNIPVELSGGQKVTTDVTGRALFTVSNQPGKLTAKMFGQENAASTIVMAPDGSAPEATSKGGLAVLSYPHFVAIHDQFALGGSGFRGAADANHVYLNDDPCLVLASSPLSLVAMPGPHVPVGDVNLHVTVAGNDAGQFPISAVLLEFSGPAEAVNAGSIGKLIVRARGTTQPLLLEVRNASPRVIRLSKGNLQRLKTSGGDQNIAPVEVEFVTGGNYVVSARLLPPDPALPDLELARKRLAEARKIASGDWPARIDQILLNIDQAPRNLPQIRAELKSMLDYRPASPLASLLDSAWRELN